MHQLPFALARDEGERLQFGETVILLRAAHGGATVWEEIAPLLDTPMHLHANEDELFHIIDGEHAFRCGEQEFRVGPGAFVYLPRGVPHAHRRMVEGAGRFLVITTPGGFEGFFRMLMAADQAGELGSDAYARASAQFGLTWLA
jgi:mannose-6-phosphate isomerase-like protein (cupin superfamily)